MSKTVYVQFRGHDFWAFDVVSGIFLKHLIDVAAPRLAVQPEPWLAEAVERWRFIAVIGDYKVVLDDNWSAEQIRTVRELATAACDVLSNRSEISAEEMSSWPLLDGEGVFPRGLASVTTASVIRLGRAIIQLLDGTLPEAPRGTAWWLFGTEDHPTTLGTRDGDSRDKCGT
jgi:hypothetical protein